MEDLFLRWGRRQIIALRRYQVLIPGTCKRYLIWKRGFCRCNQVNNLETGRLSWIICMSCKCNHKCSCKREVEGDLDVGETEAM